MSWADRLSPFARPEREVRAELHRLWLGAAARAGRLAAHAQLAPTAASETSLARLAAVEVGRRDAVEAVLRARGIELPAPDVAADDAGHNHWKRLVTDLDACRAAQDHLPRLRARLGQDDRGLDALLRSHYDGLRVQATELRELIARADPQARN